MADGESGPPAPALAGPDAAPDALPNEGGGGGDLVADAVVDNEAVKPDAESGEIPGLDSTGASALQADVSSEPTDMDAVPPSAAVVAGTGQEGGGSTPKIESQVS